jgi:hypothetical protein
MCVTINGILDWILDLLTTCTQSLELQAVTGPSVIPTIAKSPQNPLNLFQPVVSSRAVPWQWLLTVEILQLHMLKSSLNGGSLPTDTFLHRLLYKTDLVA